MALHASAPQDIENRVIFYNPEDSKSEDDYVVRIEHARLDPPIGDVGMKKSPSLSNFYSKRTTVNIQWKNISLTTSSGTPILKKLSGDAYSGELTAIMGPSGAGKSSLLNVLSGFTRHRVTGQILVNGANREMRVFRKLTSYILQDDHVLPRLTVREIVSIAASLKIPLRISKRERQNAVDNCLCCLGLEGQSNKKASELSGGQIKRLCIAQELVSNPPVVFLDEPTSGLDSSSCLQCIQLLKSLAEEGRTVVCTIHQPSSKIYEIFDKLYTLADGHCIYRGSTQNLVSFLSEQGLVCPQYHNPADFVIEVAMGDYGDWNTRLKNVVDASDEENESNHMSASVQELNHKNLSSHSIHKTSESQAILDADHKDYATSIFNQFKVLFFRKVICIIRHPMNLQIKFLGNVFFCLLMGAVYYGIGNDASKVMSNAILMFCMNNFFIACAAVPTILTFTLDRTVFERELMNSWYSTRTFYIATTAADIPFQICYPIAGCSIIYWMTGQPNDMTRFGLYLLSVVFITLVSESLGQLIGALTNVPNGIFIVTIAIVHIILFSGFFVRFNDIPSYLQWLSYLCIGRYSLQSVLLALYSMDRPPLPCNATLCPFEDPTVFLEAMQLEGYLYVDFLALLGFFVFFRALTYLTLEMRLVHMK